MTSTMAHQGSILQMDERQDLLPNWASDFEKQHPKLSRLSKPSNNITTLHEVQQQERQPTKFKEVRNKPGASDTIGDHRSIRVNPNLFWLNRNVRWHVVQSPNLVLSVNFVFLFACTSIQSIATVYKHQEAGSVSWGTADSIAVIQTCIAQYLSLYNTLVSASQDGDTFKRLGIVEYCWICLAALGPLIAMIIYGVWGWMSGMLFFIGTLGNTLLQILLLKIIVRVARKAEGLHEA